MASVPSDRLGIPTRLRIYFWLMFAGALAGPAAYIPLSFSRAYFFTWFRLATALFGGVLLWLLWQKGWRWLWQRLIPATTWLRWIIIFHMSWIAYGFVSLLWVKDLHLGIRYLLQLGPSILLVLSIPVFIQTLPDLRRAVTWVLAASSGIILFSMLEGLMGWHLPASRLRDLGRVSITSVFHNENDLAAMVVITLPLFLTGMSYCKTRWIRAGLYLVVVSGLSALYYTGSRAGLLASLVVGVLWWATLPLQKGVRGPQAIKTLVYNAAWAVVTLFLAFAWVQVLIPPDRAESLARDQQDLLVPSKVHDDNEERLTSLQIRLNLQRNGWELIKQSRFMGVGPGNVEAYMKDMPGVDGILNLHNWWGEVAVNFGALIAVPYGFLYVWTLWRLWQYTHGDRPRSPLLQWLTSSHFLTFAAFPLVGLAPSSMVFFHPFWIHYGLAWAILRLAESEHGDPVSLPSHQQPVKSQ